MSTPELDRRQFVVGTAAAAAAAALARTAGADEKPEPKPKRRLLKAVKYGMVAGTMMSVFDKFKLVEEIIK